MNLIISIIVFVFGSAIGSFISVVVHRTNTKNSKIAFSRSACPSCKKTIKWRHLVPVMSWIFLQGKCAYCKKKISYHYLLLELLTGLLFLAAFLKWNFIQIIPSTVDPNFFQYLIDWEKFRIFTFYIIEFGLLITMFFYDLRYKEILDRFSLPAIAIAFLGGLIFGTPTLTSMLVGGAAVGGFFLLQYIVSKGAWIGGGDLRLGALMGILLGWEKGLLALILSYFIGGIFSVYLIATKKVTKKSTIPFGPFLVSGTVIAIFFGKEIIDWYFSYLLF